jgi:L-ascorbate metabolism protein UlaG (beta-lactamase superfamily)
MPTWKSGIASIALVLILAIGLVTSLVVSLGAQTRNQPSTCRAIAQGLPNVVYASLSNASLETHQVRITFSGHSTYLIESAGGISIATDFSGYAGSSVPNVVTMNNAHSTHFTDFPDAAIDTVLRGWNPQGGPAAHYLNVGDVLIRNVTTDVLFGNVRIADGNSIFIFEVAGLCIGHLGHLHHDLTDAHYADIGRLDVVMVPIDGAMTLSLEGMTSIVQRLRSSIILPMHARGWATPADLISRLGPDFDHTYLDKRSFVVSLFDLPKRPTVIVPQGL